MSRFAAYRKHSPLNYFQNTEIGQKAISDDVFDGLLQKAQYDTSMQGIVNQLFGAVLYNQENMERQFLAALPQVDRSGEVSLNGSPIAKAFRAAHNPVALQTHSEGGSVPSGTTFDVEEVEYDVKRSETVLEVSDLQQIEAAISDSNGLDEFMELQQEYLDLAIDRDALAAPALEADSAYGSTDTVTPLDRAIASSDEENNADDVNDTAYTDGALDYGTVDRSADSWADAFVDHNSAGGNRQLTKDLMNSFLDGWFDFGSATPENAALLTGRKTATILSEIQADETTGTAIMFDGEDTSRDGVNDASTIPGMPGTTQFRHYRGIPIIPNQSVATDGVPRIYGVDLGLVQGEPRIAIENYADPYMEVAGRGQTQGYLATGEYKEKALFLRNHELVVRDFSSTAKLRDLSA